MKEGDKILVGIDPYQKPNIWQKFFRKFGFYKGQIYTIVNYTTNLITVDHPIKRVFEKDCKKLAKYYKKIKVWY